MAPEQGSVGLSHWPSYRCWSGLGLLLSSCQGTGPAFLGGEAGSNSHLHAYPDCPHGRRKQRDQEPLRKEEAGARGWTGLPRLGYRPPPPLHVGVSPLHPGLCRMLEDKCVSYYDHLTDEKGEVQNRQLPCPRSPDQQAPEPPFTCKVLSWTPALLPPHQAEEGRDPPGEGSSGRGRR